MTLGVKISACKQWYWTCANHLREIEEAYARSTESAEPFSLFNIELTNRCPMRCVMCPRTHRMTREQGLMDYELFVRIVDELAKVNPSNPGGRDGVVWLHHFGESLLHPEFARCIRYAEGKGIKTGLSVNPIMLTAEKASDLLDASPTKLMLSLDGHDDESFERIRGMKGSYAQSCEHVEHILRLKRERGCKTFIILSIIDFHMNQDGLEMARVRWADRKELNEIYSKSFCTWDGSDPSINALKFWGRRSKKQWRKPIPCDFPWLSMTITWNGDVVPCCYDYDAKYVLGNVRHQRLQDVWNGSSMRALRRELLAASVSNPLCRTCTMTVHGRWRRPWDTFAYMLRR